MALSDVLQFDCFVDNEIARNATKNFAGMLGKAFEQYKSKYISYIVFISVNEFFLFIFLFIIMKNYIYKIKII